MEFQVIQLTSCRNVELKKEICELIGHRKKNEPCPTSDKDKQKWNRRLSKDEWLISTELLVILRDAKQVMVDFQSATHPTLSLVAPAIVYLRQSCKESISKLTTPSARAVAAVMFKSLKERFSPLLEQPIYSIATFVDPLTRSAFTKLAASAQDETINFIQSQSRVELGAVAQHSANIKSWKDFKAPTTTAHFNVSHYLSSASPLAHQPPFIQNLYYELCGIPATSSDVERFFSTCGHINSQLRSSLKPENVEEGAVLKKNARVVETFNKASFPKEPISKLTNWLAALPKKLDRPFFDDDDNPDDVSLLGLVEEDVALQEATSASSASSDDGGVISDLLSDAYWCHSTCPKNFSQQVAVLQPGAKRKRAGEDEDDDSRGRKRQRIFSVEELIPVTYPFKGQRVWVHFTDDCVCGLTDKRKCTCNLWFEGKVQYHEDTDDKKQSFVISFHDGEEAEVEWEIEGKNDWWLTCTL